MNRREIPDAGGRHHARRQSHTRHRDWHSRLTRTRETERGTHAWWRRHPSGGEHRMGNASGKTRNRSAEIEKVVPLNQLLRR